MLARRNLDVLALQVSGRSWEICGALLSALQHVKLSSFQLHQLMLLLPFQFIHVHTIFICSLPNFPVILQHGGSWRFVWPKFLVWSFFLCPSFPGLVWVRGWPVHWIADLAGWKIALACFAWRCLWLLKTICTASTVNNLAQVQSQRDETPRGPPHLGYTPCPADSSDLFAPRASWPGISTGH